MLENWISDPSKVGATALLVWGCYAFWKGLIVPRWTYDALKEECDLYRERNNRLLTSMEQQLGIAERTADVAANVVKKVQ